MSTENINGKEVIVPDLLNKLFLKYKETVSGPYHTLLWKLLMDGFKDINKGSRALYLNITRDGYMIGICDKNSDGYISTHVYVEINNYEEAEKMIEDLNIQIFGLDEKEAFKIAFSSMFANKQ